MELELPTNESGDVSLIGSAIPSSGAGSAPTSPLGYKRCPKCECELSALEYYKNRSKKDGLSSYCKKCYNLIIYFYRISEKGKATTSRYWKSERGKAVIARYQKTEKGKIVAIRCRKSEKGKASRARCKAHYRITVKGKATETTYRKSEKNRLYQAYYKKLPKSKAADAHYEKSKEGRIAKARYLKSEKGKLMTSRKDYKRRIRKIGATEGVVLLTITEWKIILATYNNACAYCGATNKKLEKDHIIPISKGGKHAKENVVPACRSCNSRKGAKLITAGPSAFAGVDVALVNPARW